MRIKLDENMPSGLSSILRNLGHDADTVIEEGMAGHSDGDIWDNAQHQGRFLITQDLDFSDIHRFTPGTHHGILLVRLRSPGRHALSLRVRELFENEDVTGWQGCFIVATNRKLRIRRPI